MATSLILHKRITTTTAKAKALRMFVEPIITKSKEDSTHSRRMVFSYLKDKEAVAELFREVSPKITDRKGGYTRILKIGNRIGDNADMCIMELVDYNEAMLGGEAAKTKTTRRRRSTGKKKDETTAEVKAPKAAKAKVEKPVEKAEESAGESTPEEK
jgi:large subunit ribosomal protein L17